MGQVLVLGLVYGVIYSLFAVGIVLVYRGSGTINFAQGEIGTFGLFVAWWFTTAHHLPWIIGAVAALVMAAALGAGFEWAIVSHMVEANRVSVAVATIGLLAFLVAFEVRFFEGGNIRKMVAPIRGTGWSVFGVVVSPTQILSLLAAGALAAGLALLLKKTDFGLGVLAAAQDPVAVRLVGIPLARVSAFVWGLGAAVSVLGALFIEPTIGVFTPGFASEMFIKGLAAAVVGGLTSLEGAFVGGLLIGFVEVGANRVFDFPGVKMFSILFVMLLVLLVKPDGLMEGFKFRRRALA
ncbi:MAG: branched-chain amino acid transport system permease protein [Actinomycetota bacterium]|jgi:branched-chain amino acid transport system permease protein|nr:branched-chain amino acid transport system permease protein [Actinomycetota bacterium]